MGRTHVENGVLLWLAAGPALTRDPETFVAGTVLAAVLPLGADLDHGNSTASRALWGPLHRRVGNLVAGVLGGHRAGAHSLWAILVAGLLAGVLATALGFGESRHALAAAASLGWAGGVLPDMLTRQRVRVLWPVSRARVGLPIFETNTLGETFFRWLQRMAILVVVLQWTF